jgi:hypothetical protein
MNVRHEYFFFILKLLSWVFFIFPPNDFSKFILLGWQFIDTKSSAEERGGEATGYPQSFWSSPSSIKSRNRNWQLSNSKYAKSKNFESESENLKSELSTWKLARFIVDCSIVVQIKQICRTERKQKARSEDCWTMNLW